MTQVTDNNPLVFCLVVHIDLGYHLHGVFTTEEKAEKAKVAVIKNATHPQWNPNPTMLLEIIACKLDMLDYTLNIHYNKNETF